MVNSINLVINNNNTWLFLIITTSFAKFAKYCQLITVIGDIIINDYQLFFNNNYQ